MNIKEHIESEYWTTEDISKGKKGVIIGNFEFMTEEYEGKKKEVLYGIVEIEGKRKKLKFVKPSMKILSEAFGYETDIWKSQKIDLRIDTIGKNEFIKAYPEVTQ